ncbi:hypothetical protein ACHAXS_001298 [Conticribra weissflogii]
MLYLGRSLEEAYWGFRDDHDDEPDDDKEDNDDKDDNNGVDQANCSWPPRKKRPKERLGKSSFLPARSGAASSASSSSSDLPPPSSPFAKLHPLPPFHDASPIICTFDGGLDQTIKHGFFRFADAVRRPHWVASSPSSTCPSSSCTSSTSPSPFDIHQYEHFEQVEHGDCFCILSPSDLPNFVTAGIRHVDNSDRN